MPGFSLRRWRCARLRLWLGIRASNPAAAHELPRTDFLSADHAGCGRARGTYPAPMPFTFVEDIEMAHNPNDDFNNQGSGLSGASGSSTGGFGNSGDLDGSAGYGTSGTGGFGSTSGASRSEAHTS